jgi:hypothetical protein
MQCIIIHAFTIFCLGPKCMPVLRPNETSGGQKTLHPLGDGSVWLEFTVLPFTLL